MEQRHEPPNLTLVGRRYLAGPQCPPGGVRRVTLAGDLFGECDCGCGCALTQPLALAVEPLLEVRRAGNEETIQQIAAIEDECLIGLLCEKGGVERGDIRPQHVPGDADLFVAVRHDDVTAQ